MTRFFAIAFAAVLFIGMPVAHASDGYTTHNVNLRAGPDGGYPLVRTMSRGERIDIYGCLNGLQWCDIRTQSGERGWVYAYYLRTWNAGRPVTIIQSNSIGNTHIVIFKPNNYWYDNYRDRDFYRQRGRWIRDDDDHHGNHHNDNDDEDDHHGSHHDNNDGHGRNDDDRKPVVVKPPKYQKMKMPGNDDYNPLCRMGENDCGR